MEQDDVPIGRVLTRRDALAVIGVSGITLLGAHRGLGGRFPGPADPLPVCVVRPEQTEGPYFVDEQLNRSDIRTDPTTGAASAGTPLEITIRVFNGACAPLAGAHVDIWHCDAAGKYSDESANSTVGQKFLRGYQVTDENGAVKFTTIYPGWYMGRAVHIHFKIRTYDGTSQTSTFTSQFFFDDAQ